MSQEKHTPQEEKQKTSSKFNLLVSGILLPSPIVAAAAIIHLTDSMEAKNQLLPHLPAGWNLESKLMLLSKVGFLCAMFILFNVLATLVARVSLLAYPLIKEDPPLVKLLNRILSNTVEQFAIFLPVLCYWTLCYCKEDQKYLVLLYGLIWVGGRVLFFLGYCMFLVKPKLSSCRAYGLSFTIATTGFIVKRILFDDVVQNSLKP
jgi:uncharacterized membrane protein YecN with MAPEG domain